MTVIYIRAEKLLHRAELVHVYGLTIGYLPAYILYCLNPLANERLKSPVGLGSFFFTATSYSHLELPFTALLQGCRGCDEVKGCQARRLLAEFLV